MVWLKAKLQLHDHRAVTVMRDVAMGNLYGCMQVLETAQTCSPNYSALLLYIATQHQDFIILYLGTVGGYTLILIA
jgi:hypothetical protein